MEQRPQAAEAASVDLLHEMNAVGGALFVVGGSLVLFVAGVSSWSPAHFRWLLVAGVVALVAGAALLGLAGRRPFPTAALAGFTGFATFNISLAVWASGADGAAIFGVLYVFVTMYSFYYFDTWLAVVQGLLTAVAYAVSLALVEAADPATLWGVVTSANILLAVLIGQAAQRMRRILVAEQAAVARLEELDELRTAFLRAVSHELRTPLTSLIGYAGLLAKRRPTLSPEQVDQFVGHIQKNAGRLERLLANLLDIDRISRGVIVAQRERVDVGRIVEEALRHLPTGTHDVTVENIGKPVASVEPSKVERIVENLVGNAIKHTPQQTHIRVLVHEDGDGVVIVVEDDGPGIPADLQDEIFEPFVQGPASAEAASPGTGIGLALVEKFAQLHGGGVRLTTSASGGSRFEVSLPGSQPEPAQPGDVNAVASRTRA